jgi:hypothetical protein
MNVFFKGRTAHEDRMVAVERDVQSSDWWRNLLGVTSIEEVIGLRRL